MEDLNSQKQENFALVGIDLVIEVVDLILLDNSRMDSLQEYQLNTSSTTVVVADKVEARLSHMVVFAMVNNTITRSVKIVDIIIDFSYGVASQASYSPLDFHSY